MFQFKWRNNKLLLSCLVLILSFLYALPIANKLWHPFDEGWVLGNADLVFHGKIPYKDFWALNSPGQFYILALLFKIFGKSLIIGRIYTIILHSLICLMVFLITKKLCRLKYALWSWFICMVSLVPRLGPTPANEWSAVLFALFSLMALFLYIERQGYPWLILAGLLVGLTFLFRHDFGIYILIAEIITVFLLSISRQSLRALFSLEKLKKLLWEFTLFLLPIFIVLSSTLYYFISKSALADLFYQLFYIPLKVYPQIRGIAFPKFCFNPNMLFHQSCYFIVVNQFYIPIIIGLVMLSLLLVRIFKQKSLVGEDFILVALFLSGALHFNHVRVRSDIMHLVPIMPFFLVLFGFLFSRLDEVLYFYRHRYLRKTIVIFVFVFMGSFVVKNIDVYTKHTLRKPIQGKITLVDFELGTVYIPRKDARFVKEVVSFIRNNTVEGERIFVGNSSHHRTE